MNTPLFHRILNEKRGDNHYYCNAFVISDINPSDIIDCTPEGSFENFQHIVNGDCLVYCELANSTPFDGYRVKKKFKPLVNLNARTTCVFDSTEIRSMLKSVVGTKIVKEHIQYAWAWNSSIEIGKVVDASVLKDNYKDGEFLTLCTLCWIDKASVDRFIYENGLLYLSFGINVSKEVCCKCGKTSYNGTPCDHIKNNSIDSALSICTFKKFFEIALEK